MPELPRPVRSVATPGDGSDADPAEVEVEAASRSQSATQRRRARIAAKLAALEAQSGPAAAAEQACFPSECSAAPAAPLSAAASSLLA